jgi:hypothetical protein
MMVHGAPEVDGEEAMAQQVGSAAWTPLGFPHQFPKPASSVYQTNTNRQVLFDPKQLIREA